MVSPFDIPIFARRGDLIKHLFT